MSRGRITPRPSCENTTKVRSTPLAALCATLILGTGFAAQPASARNLTYPLNMPEQSLRDALQALALASHHKLLYLSNLVRGKNAPALKGDYTLEQALHQLLSPAHLTYEITPDGLVLIRSRDAPVKAPSRLPPVHPTSSLRTQGPSNAKDPL